MGSDTGSFKNSVISASKKNYSDTKNVALEVDNRGRNSGVTYDETLVNEITNFHLEKTNEYIEVQEGNIYQKLPLPKKNAILGPDNLLNQIWLLIAVMVNN